MTKHEAGSGIEMNIGIFGLGFMGATHAVKYSGMPGARIAAVCARDEQRLSGKFSGQSGNLGFTFPDLDLSKTAKYKTWKQLIADPGVDAIDICGPSDLHAEIAVAALEYGKHVFCEKPMALTVEDCDRMLHAAAKANRILMIAHVLRFWPAYEFLRAWIAQRESGELTQARFRRQCGIPAWGAWQGNEQRSGGALLDLLIHDIDQILLLFGMPAKLRAEPMGNFGAVDARLLYSNGLDIQLAGGWVGEGTPFSMEFRLESAGEVIRFWDNVLTVTNSEGEQPVNLPPDDAFEKELHYFIGCCENGEAPALCPPEDSRAAVQIALLLRQSQQSGGCEIACGQLKNSRSV